MAEYAFYFDASRCTGCKTCELACKDYHDLSADVAFRKVYEYCGGGFTANADGTYTNDVWGYYTSMNCNHCENPACVAACPVGAYERREDGIVVHHQELCIGCKNCIRSCPYGAPRFNETLKKSEKCSMCYERQDIGMNPACVDACPVGALSIIDLESDNLPTNAVQYPPGFPKMPKLNPGTRFILAHTPKQPGDK